MYDPAILPPLAPLIYIGSDLPILCITRARIVISLWASEVQSSGMAVAGARSRARIYRFAPCIRVRLPYSADGNREIHDPYSHRAVRPDRAERDRCHRETGDDFPTGLDPLRISIFGSLLWIDQFGYWEVSGIANCMEIRAIDG